MTTVGGEPVCLAAVPWAVSQGQAVVLGTAVVLGLLGAALYRWWSRRKR